MFHEKVTMAAIGRQFTEYNYFTTMQFIFLVEEISLDKKYPDIN